MNLILSGLISFIVALAVAVIGFHINARRRITVLVSVPQDGKNSITTFLVIANESHAVITIEDLEYKHHTGKEWKRLLSSNLPLLLKPFEANRIETELFNKENNIDGLRAIDSFGKKWDCGNVAEANKRIANYKTIGNIMYPDLP